MTNEYDYDGLPTVEKITKNKIGKKFLCKDTNKDRYINDLEKKKKMALISIVLLTAIGILFVLKTGNIPIFLYPIYMYNILTLISLWYE